MEKCRKFKKHTNIYKMKQTLVIGATTKEDRYANRAIRALRSHKYPVVAFGQKAGSVLDVDIETEWNPGWDIETVTLYLGPQNQKEYIDNNAINGTNFPNDIIRTMNAAGLITSATSTKEEWSLLSYLARVNYSYDDKYLVTAAFRQDGSSRFGFDNRWGFFPSFSLGWRLSEENFLKNDFLLISCGVPKL